MLTPGFRSPLRNPGEYDRPTYARHTGAQVGELVVELPLAVGGIEGKQDPGELAEIFRGDRALYDS